MGSLRHDVDSPFGLLHQSLSSTLRSLLGSPLRIPGLDLRLRTPDLLRQEVHSLICSYTISQMGGQNSQSADANQVSWLADDLDLLLREVGDLVPVLKLLSTSLLIHA